MSKLATGSYHEVIKLSGAETRFKRLSQTNVSETDFVPSNRVTKLENLTSET
jgi:hypothetical protein